MLACSGASWNEVNFTHHKLLLEWTNGLCMETVWSSCLVHSCIKSHGFFHHQNIAQRLSFEFSWFLSITVVVRAALSMLKFDTLDSTNCQHSFSMMRCNWIWWIWSYSTYNSYHWCLDGYIYLKFAFKVSCM
jgi:hypothetical protein